MMRRMWKCAWILLCLLMGGSPAQAQTGQAKPISSPPIKAELIGKPDDAQLKLALAYLDHSNQTNGPAR